MGGIGEVNDEAFVLNDVILLNIDENSVQVVIPN